MVAIVVVVVVSVLIVSASSSSGSSKGISSRSGVSIDSSSTVQQGD